MPGAQVIYQFGIASSIIVPYIQYLSQCIVVMTLGNGLVLLTERWKYTMIYIKLKSTMPYGITRPQQATGLDAWASTVKCPAWFVSHLHKICIYIWVVYSFCLFCCLFIIVRWWYVWCIEWASGNQEEVQACLVTLWLFIKSCYSLYKTTLGLLCSWFENNPYFHKYSTDFHV